VQPIASVRSRHFLSILKALWFIYLYIHNMYTYVYIHIYIYIYIYTHIQFKLLFKKYQKILKSIWGSSPKLVLSNRTNHFFAILELTSNQPPKSSHLIQLLCYAEGSERGMTVVSPCLMDNSAIAVRWQVLVVNNTDWVGYPLPPPITRQPTRPFAVLTRIIFTLITFLS
jgi:hypothetical protein